MAFGALLGSANVAGAQVKGRVRRVGLFEGATPMVRSGCTSFVEVELAWSGAEPFKGELRLSQVDRDGDVAMSVQDVGLTPDGEWRPYQLYFFPATVSANSSLRIRLFDGEGTLARIQADTGELANELVSPPYIDSPSPDEYLVVDLTSPKKLAHVTCLDSAQQADKSFHARMVRPLAPRELPQEWQGLEAVDAIVWDDADPSELSERQTESLINWVKNGGSLLITTGKNWQALAQSSLAKSLPATISDIADATEVPEFTADILKNDSFATDLETQYKKKPVGRCHMEPHPGAISIPAERKEKAIAFRSLLGRGNLTLIGASFRDLLPAPSSTQSGETPVEGETKTKFDEFKHLCDKIIAVNMLALPEAREVDLTYSRRNLFDTVASTISFKGLGFAFMMFAMLFTIAYLLTASLSYLYLKRRDWQQHSWSAFLGISLVATLIGIATVWTLRGFSTKVRQTTIIDATAGEDYGYATCLFGVKTPDHTRLNLRLPAGYADALGPSQLGLLRTLPSSTSIEISEASFVATDTYRTQRAAAALEGVPVRATLKEFCGRWHGPLGGTLDAKFVIPGGSNDQIGAGSYLKNNTGVELQHCYILEGKQEIAGESGIVVTRCLSLGTLPKDGADASLDGAALNRRLYFKPDNGPTPIVPPVQIPGNELQINKAIGDWTRQTSALPTGGGADSPDMTADSEYYSLLLLSVFDLIEKDPNSRTLFTQSHGRNLDCSHAITRSTAILIGYSTEPAPVQLEINGAMRKPEKSLTMYRFVIPVERQAAKKKPKAETTTQSSGSSS